MKHLKRRLPTLFLITSAALFQALAPGAEAHGQRGARVQAPARGPAHGAQARAQSHRSAPRQHARPTRQPRSLLPPAGLGSAANARPGFYQQLNAPRPHHRGHGHRAAPIYVYVEPLYSEPFYPEPRRVEPAPAPAPQPIYIVAPPAPQPPAAAAPAQPVPIAPPPPPPERSTEPGEVRFSIRPANARVFLDDDYLGTGAELAAVPPGQLFAPGVHVLEVTHPDHRPQRLVFGVSHKAPTHVLIDLSTDRVGRRSRVK